MEFDDLEHINNLLSRRYKNLKLLEKQAAVYGSLNVPLHIQNQIDEEINEIERLEKSRKRVISKLIESVEVSKTNDTKYYDDEEMDLELADEPELVSSQRDRSIVSNLKGLLILIGVGIFVIFIIYDTVSHQASFKIRDDFNYTEGLRSWRSSGAVGVTNENREQPRSTGSSSSGATASSTRDGVAEVQASSQAFIYHKVSEVASQGHIYKAMAWCKAPVGTSCRMFLGGVDEGKNLPLVENYRTTSVEGTDQWESMVISFEVEQDEELYIFLYAEGQNASILFDDVSVQIIN